MVKKFLIAWGNWHLSPDYKAMVLEQVKHHDMMTCGFEHAQQVPSIKQSNPAIKVLGYIDLAIGRPTLQSVTNTWNTNKSYGYDGIFFDDLWSQPPIDWMTHAQMKQFLRDVKATLGCIIIGNGPDVDYAGDCDGIMEEGFTVHERIDPLGHIQRMLTVTSQNKICVAAVHNREYDVSDTEETCQFALGCFLCADNNGKGYFSVTDIWDTSRGWWQMMDVDPGTPQGAYTQTGNILTRMFTKAKVTVNLDLKTAIIETIEPPPVVEAGVDWKVPAALGFIGLLGLWWASRKKKR
jgi:hypothetical protein